jgi:cytidine deaminase
MPAHPLEATITAQIGAPDFAGYLEPGSLDPDTAPMVLNAAASMAQVPVSGFRVGALALGHSGRIYLGANLEFSAVPLSSSLHAEQSAVINAWMHGESGISAIHVSEQPCGHCLQFLQELDQPDAIDLFVNGTACRLRDLLTRPFVLPDIRGKGIFGRPPQTLVDLKPTEDLAAQRSVNAASHSYCPYSGSAEGCVLETISGHIFAGRAVESAAYNPSVPPIIVALNQRNLSAWRNEAITRAVHAKLATAINHSLSLSKAILQATTRVDLEVRLMETRY